MSERAAQVSIVSMASSCTRIGTAYVTAYADPGGEQWAQHVLREKAATAGADTIVLWTAADSTPFDYRPPAQPYFSRHSVDRHTGIMTVGAKL